MALPVTIPNTFANATASIPLSQLDTNFTTLANAVNGISSGSETLANASVTVITAGTVDINGGTIDGTAIGGSTAAAGSFTTLNTSGQVVFNDAGADVDFRVEGDTNANLLFVDASADAVGIGTSSPTARLDVSAVKNTTNIKLNSTGLGSPDDYTELSFGASSNSYGAVRLGYNNPASTTASYLAFYNNTGSATTERMRIDSSGNLDLIQSANLTWRFAPASTIRGSISVDSGDVMYFRNGSGNTERARITSGGFFKAKGNETNYFNTAASNHEFTNGTGDIQVTVNRHTAASPYGTYTYFSAATPNNTTNYFEYYEDSTNEKAILYSNGSWQVRANSYGGISDVKLKQDIVDANSQWDDIKGLRIRKYRFKDEAAVDPDYPAHLGVIAQEAEIVSPGLVYESPDFKNVKVPVLDDEGNPVLDEEGNPQVTTERQATGTVTKGVKYSILYMKAVKALQEAIERIETLEAKVAALEAK